MELHANCRQRLREEIQSTLAVTQVKHGYFLQLASLRGLTETASILPRNLQETVRGWISDEPIRDFVFGLLGEELRQLYPYDSSEEVYLLQEFPEYSDVFEVAGRIVTAFESLPWTYSLVFPTSLPVDDLSTRAIGKSLNIGEGLRLVAGDFIPTDLPLEEGPEAPFSFASIFQRDRGPSRWKESSFYVVREASGFIADHLKTRTFQDFELVLRSLGGIGLANKAFSLRRTYSLVPREDPIYIYVRRDGSNILKRSQLVPAQFSEVLGNLIWWEQLQSGPAPEAARFLAKLCREMCVPFEAGADREAVRLAGQWYFDGRCSTDELLSFVQSMVALEIMLGDKATSDLLGLGKLLANRCAYLIGKTSAHRREILEKFDRIYDTRSQIVHRGKNRLSPQEREGLYSARWMCERVIQEEIRLLLADQAS